MDFYIPPLKKQNKVDGISSKRDRDADVPYLNGTLECTSSDQR